MGPVHDALGIVCKGVAPMHGAPVVPNDEITQTPLVVPDEPFLCHLFPKSVQEFFGIVQGQAVDVGAVPPSQKVFNAP